MSERTTPKPHTHAADAPGRLGCRLADLGLMYVLMLCASIGGSVWLAAIYLARMQHDAALIVALASGAGAFARGHQLVARAVNRRAATERAKQKPEVPS